VGAVDFPARFRGGGALACEVAFENDGSMEDISS
jgi:hypothetical protein